MNSKVKKFLFEHNLKNNNLNDISSLSIRLEDLLSVQSTYTVQDFQRQYKWDKENIKQLLDDLISEETQENNLFLGTITLSKIYDDLNNLEYEIVDGQQRLITSTLILKSLEIIKGVDLSSFYLNLNNSNIKLNNLRGQGVYEKILKISSDFYIFNGQENYYKNFKKEFNKIHIPENVKPFKENFLEIFKNIFYLFLENSCFIEKIKENILSSYIVLIRIPYKVSSTEIFESINSKGKFLTIDELLKNYFYLKATKIFKESELENIKNKIEKIFLDVKEIFLCKENGPFIHIKRYFHSYINYTWAFRGYKDKNLSSLPISEENPRKQYIYYKKFNIIDDKQSFNSLLLEVENYMKTINEMRTLSKEYKEENFDDFKFKVSLSSLTNSPLIMPLLYFLRKEIKDNNEFKLCISYLYKYFIFSILNESNKQLKLSYNIISYLRKNFESSTLKDEEKKDLFKKVIDSLINKNDDFAIELKMPGGFINVDIIDNKVDSWKKIKVYDKKQKNDFSIFFKYLMFLINNYLFYKKDEFNIKVDYKFDFNDLFISGKYTYDHIVPQSFGEKNSKNYINGISWDLFDSTFKDSFLNIMIIKGRDNENDEIPEKKIPKIYLFEKENCTAISIYFSKKIKEINSNAKPNEIYKYNDFEKIINPWMKELCSLIKIIIL